LPVLVTTDLDILQEVFIKQYANFSARKVSCFSVLALTILFYFSSFLCLKEIANPTKRNQQGHTLIHGDKVQMETATSDHESYLFSFKT
jgi:hypothetical protein